jgi:acetolactate synthase-1/2/3 large subunit
MHSAGVGVLFGLPGGGANLDVVGAAAEAGIEFVLRACQVVCVS